MTTVARAQSGPVGRAVLIAVKAATLVYFVIHFGLTLLYVGPINPVKLRNQRLLGMTIGNLFPQNWSFFAPNPMASNQVLLIHCVQPNESPSLPTAGWYDVSSPLIRRHQQQRFSAYDRLNRPQAMAIRDYVTGGQAATPFVKGCRNGSQAACETLSRIMEQSRNYNGQILEHVASCFCKQVSPNSTEAILRYRESPAREWPKRFAAPPPAVDRDIGRVKLDRDVVDAGFYLRQSN